MTISYLLYYLLKLSGGKESGKEGGRAEALRFPWSSQLSACTRAKFSRQPRVHKYFPFTEVQMSRLGRAGRTRAAKGSQPSVALAQPHVHGAGTPATNTAFLHSKQHLSLKLFLFLLLFLPFLSLFSDIFFALISLIKSKNTWEQGGRLERTEKTHLVTQ